MWIKGLLNFLCCSRYFLCYFRCSYSTGHVPDIRQFKVYLVQDMYPGKPIVPELVPV